jgi:putative zinc ribbon protein
MADQTLECKDCRAPFEFTSGEQDFYKAKNFQPPVRCKACRQKKKAEKEAAGLSGSSAK